MFTLVGFNEITTATGDYENIAAAKDQMTHVVDDVLYVPDKFTKMLWCAAVGSDIVRAKLESPSIRRIGVMMIEPKVNIDYAEFKRWPVARYTPRSPITLAAGEGLEAKVYVPTNITHWASVGVCLGDALVTPVEGEIWTVRATFESLTLIQSEWKNTEITFDETLPVGRYQIVGCSAYCYHGMLFRIAPVGLPNRPGGLCTNTEGSIEPAWQRLGGMGVWCEFHSSTPPSFDFLGISTTAFAGSVELDIIKIA